MLTTKEAFEKLVSKRAWYKPLNIPDGTANWAKSMFKKGKLSNNIMDDYLEKAGYSVASEKSWHTPSDENRK